MQPTSHSGGLLTADSVRVRVRVVSDVHSGPMELLLLSAFPLPAS